MGETDIECGHSKATLHASGVNRSCKIITFSHLNSTNVNDNFMQEKSSKHFNVGSTLLLGWSDIPTLHIVKPTLKQRCVGPRWNLQC